MYSIFDMLQSLCSLDEVNVDYGKLLKPTAVEGLRVEDLVKQYFEATEQVLHTHTITYTHFQGVITFIFVFCFYFLKCVCVLIFTDGAAVPSDGARHGEGHSGVCRQR